ncbi:MAG: 4-hydroxythreonine-4-phosphate dehydrogenase PdxA [Ignavibacteriales bacterium]|nr:4-hydroxythreonine-4-phosphate dehydrogenase PdxA [Ignavibacteriales bacterium]
MKPVVAITIGDFNGIGPEIVLKSATLPAIRRICIPLLIGPLGVFEHIRSDIKLKVKLEKAAAVISARQAIPVVDVGDGIGADVQPGSLSKTAGKSAGLAIETAVKLCLDGKAHAMVTAPVSKEALHMAGYNFPGQTEMVTLFSRSPRVAMMLVSKTMRVGLVTIHVPVRSIVDRISKDKIVEKALVVFESLKNDFRISRPRVAVLGLNPHAGEHGIIGTEEKDILVPALEELRTQGVEVEGPFPADAFFGNKAYVRYDAVLAMYHDQGLIPLKMSSFGKAVNFSAGLSVIRTSPDHGTAYDIAGKGTASIDSMIEAIKLAVQFAGHRHD